MNRLFEALKRNKFSRSIWVPLKDLYRKIQYSKFNNYPGLHGKISHKDAMFAGNIKHYISVGDSAMDNIEAALKIVNITFDSLRSVLDMPSGYGRVLRSLIAKVPPEKITACDIDADAIKFCEKEFGCKKMLSSADFSQIHFPENYSLIWVGSLFTHLDQETFSSLLKLLFDSLETGGILVFTTQGKHSVETFERYWGGQPVPLSREQLQKELEKNNGFYYSPYFNAENYGIAISLKYYVIALIERLFGSKARFIYYNERGWDDHQDVFAIQKTG
jgi:hypothetical protein